GRAATPGSGAAAGAHPAAGRQAEGGGMMPGPPGRTPTTPPGRTPPTGPLGPRPAGPRPATPTGAVRDVLRTALDTYRYQPRTAEALRHQLDRLDQPLRVAIAGKIKAGKSTLLNALVGEAIAPTDAGECTRVVTWYRDGPSPKIVLYPKEGSATPLPVVRRDGALNIDLNGIPAERVDRLVVDWPAQSLRTMTLIDTP